MANANILGVIWMIWVSEIISIMDIPHLPLDELQNITEYVYRDERCEGKLIETLAGSFHSLSESKIAPMLVTGSYVGWLLQIRSRTS